MFLIFVFLIYKSARSVSMGGVAVALPSEEEVYFFNPAMFSQGEIKSLDIIDLFLQSTKAPILKLKEGIDLVKNIQNLKANKLSPFVGEPIGLNISSFPNFSFKYAGFGLLLNFGGVVNVSNPAYLKADASSSLELVGAMGFGIPIYERFGVGANLRFGFTGYGEESISENEVLSSDKLFPALSTNLNPLKPETCKYPLNCKFGFVGVNFGTLWKPRNEIIVGADVRDVFGKTTADIGTSYTLKISKFKTLFAFDIQDIFFRYDSKVLTKIFLGGEVSTGFTFLNASIRFGLYQTYPTLGIGLKLGIVNLDFGTYGEERSWGENRVIFFRLTI